MQHLIWGYFSLFWIPYELLGSALSLLHLLPSEWQHSSHLQESKVNSPVLYDFFWCCQSSSGAWWFLVAIFSDASKDIKWYLCLRCISSSQFRVSDVWVWCIGSDKAARTQVISEQLRLCGNFKPGEVRQTPTA